MGMWVGGWVGMIDLVDLCNSLCIGLVVIVFLYSNSNSASCGSAARFFANLTLDSAFPFDWE